jgi:DNA polymerase III epsilon subunit-like protein
MEYNKGEIICTLKLSKRIFTGLESYTLKFLSEKFLNINNNQTWHRSNFDTEMTVGLFKHIYEESCMILGYEPNNPVDFFLKLSGIKSLSNTEEFIRNYKNN